MGKIAFSEDVFSEATSFIEGIKGYIMMGELVGIWAVEYIQCTLLSGDEVLRMLQLHEHTCACPGA